jgi:cytochrome c553
MSKKTLVAVLAMAACLGVAPLGAASLEGVKAEYEQALALTGDVANGKQLYLICAVCHRPEGWGTEDGTYPQIAGQLRTVIIKQLVDIRSGSRVNPVMYPFVAQRILGGPQEIADVAAYISRLPMTPRNGHGPGQDLALGKKLYAERCATCHGHQGEGDSSKPASALWGQHFGYLERELEWIKSGKRHNGDSGMQHQVRDLTERDIEAVTDYASRLSPPADRLAPSASWRNPDFPNYVRPPMPPLGPGK